MEKDLYIEFLTPETADVLNDLVHTAHFLKHFVFVGGSALAFYLKHRKSEDLDFFTWDSSLFRKDVILDYIRTLKDPEILNDSEQGIEISINKTKITFFNAGWDFLKPENISLINIASIEAIAAMKVHALFLRARFRDYYDLYFIAKTMNLKNIFKAAKNINLE